MFVASVCLCEMEQRTNWLFLCPPKRNTRKRDEGNCRETREISVSTARTTTGRKEGSEVWPGGRRRRRRQFFFQHLSCLKDTLTRTISSEDRETLHLPLCQFLSVGASQKCVCVCLSTVLCVFVCARARCVYHPLIPRLNKETLKCQNLKNCQLTLLSVSTHTHATCARAHRHTHLETNTSQLETHSLCFWLTFQGVSKKMLHLCHMGVMSLPAGNIIIYFIFVAEEATAANSGGITWQFNEENN